MTARTSAHLSANNDDTFKTFIDKRGEARRGLFVSQQAAIDRIDTIQSGNRSPVISGVDVFCFRTADQSGRNRAGTKHQRRPACRWPTMQL